MNELSLSPSADRVVEAEEELVELEVELVEPEVAVVESRGIRERALVTCIRLFLLRFRSASSRAHINSGG